MRRARESGFTLIELIVAVAVFAVVAVMAYSGLELLIHSRTDLEGQATRQREIELAVLRIERDLRQALARPVRGAYGEDVRAFVGSENSAQWSTLDLAADEDGVRAQAQRVSYALVDRMLVRVSDRVLDRSPRETGRSRKLLGEVVRIRWRYLAGPKQDSDQWPPRAGISAPEALPRAVEFRIELADLGEIQRLVELPEAPR